MHTAGLTRFTALALALAVSGHALAQNPSRYLVAISDTDMRSETYHDGELGPPVGQPDTLSIFDLHSDRTTAYGSVPASNAMNTPANSLAVTPDSTLAVLVASWEQRPDGATNIKDLPAGKHIRAYDLRNPAKPRFVNEQPVMANPSTIALHPSGKLATVLGGPIADGVFFVPIANGRLGEPKRVAVPLPARPDLGRETAMQARWHPSGEVLAILLAARSQVAFFRLEEAAAGPKLVPWGTVQVNKFPHAGEFSPDGRFFFTSDVQWGADVPKFFGTLSEGIVTTTRLAPLDDRGERPAHIVVGAVQGGYQAEFMAISPDGKLLALASIRTTSRLSSDPDYDPTAALELFSINPETGRLARAGSWPYTATNTQGLTFDRSGRRLYVGVGEYRGEEAPLKGAVEIWEVTAGPTPALVRAGKRLRAPRGVHTIAVIN